MREAQGLLEDVCCFAEESLSGNPRSALSQPTPSGPAGEEEEEEEKREQRGKGEEESLAGMSYFFLPHQLTPDAWLIKCMPHRGSHMISPSIYIVARGRVLHSKFFLPFLTKRSCTAAGRNKL